MITMRSLGRQLLLHVEGHLPVFVVIRVIWVLHHANEWHENWVLCHGTFHGLDRTELEIHNNVRRERPYVAFPIGV
jgi:hypothetical protein